MTDTTNLSTGREFKANCGIVGIDAELDVYEGYDGCVHGAALDDGDNGWSSADRAALADLMIERWQKFKDAALTQA